MRIQLTNYHKLEEGRTYEVHVTSEFPLQGYAEPKWCPHLQVPSQDRWNALYNPDGSFDVIHKECGGVIMRIQENVR